MGHHTLVRISTTQPGFDVRGNVLVCKGFESLPGYAKNTERSFLAQGWVLQVQIFISIVPITLLDCGDHDRAYQDRSFTPPMETLEPFSAPVLEFLSPLCWERHRPSCHRAYRKISSLIWPSWYWEMEPASDGDGRVLAEQSYNHYRPLVSPIDHRKLLRVFLCTNI